MITYIQKDDIGLFRRVGLDGASAVLDRNDIGEAGPF